MIYSHTLISFTHTTMTTNNFKKALPFRAITIFESAARHLNFSRAAEELCVSQSAISHQIKQLEQFLGEELFIRQRRKVALTEIGMTYFLKITSALNQISSATEKVVSNVRTDLKIFIQSAACINWLLPILPKFEQNNPDINIQVTTGWENKPFDSEQHDVFVGTWPMTEEYNSVNVADDQWFPLGSTKFFPANKSITPEKISHSLLITAEQGLDWECWFEKYIAKDTFAQFETKRFSHQILSHQAIQYYPGLILTNELTAGRLLQSDCFVSFNEFPVTLPWLQYKLYYHKSKEHRNDIHLFRDWLISLL